MADTAQVQAPAPAPAPEVPEVPEVPAAAAAETPPTPAAPPARSGPPRADDAHRSLTSGFSRQRRERTGRPTSTGGPLEAAAPLPAPGAVSREREAPVDSGAPEALHSEAAQADSPAAPAAAPAAAAPPPSAASAAEDAAPAPAETTTAPEGTPAPPPASPLSAPRAPDAVPEAFVAEVADYRDLVGDDPLLRNTLRRIWANPALSDVQKSTQSIKHLDTARAGRARAAAQQGDDRQLLEQGQYQEYHQRVRAREASEAAAHERAQAVTRLLATAFGVDEADPEFLDAGPQAGDESREVGLQRFIDWATQRAPAARALVEQARAAERAAADARVADLQAAHERALKDLEARLAGQAAADVEQARAELRAGVGGGRRPPRAGVPTVPGSEARPAAAPTLADIRGNLSAGFRLRQQAN